MRRGHESLTVETRDCRLLFILSDRLKCASVLEQVIEVASPFKMSALPMSGVFDLICAVL